MMDAGEQTIDTGHEEMDGEHRVQMELISAFRDAVAEGRGKEEVEEILVHLIDYTKIHFMSEQLLMRLHGYPRYRDHLHEHDMMIEQIDQLHERYRAGEAELSAEIAGSLAEWLVGHIRRTDRALGKYLEAVADGGP